MILLTSYWRRWLERHHPERVKQVMSVLERSAGAVVGIDGMDFFALGFEPGSLDGVASILKFQGVFRDRELYNYDVGPWYPGELVGVFASQGTAVQLARAGQAPAVRPVPDDGPTGAAAMRAPLRIGGAQTLTREISWAERTARSVGEEALSKLLEIAPVDARPLEVHRFATLTHVQRLEAIRLLEGLSGTRGIDRIPDNVAASGRA